MKFTKSRRECFFLLIFQEAFNAGEVEDFATIVYEHYNRTRENKLSEEDKIFIEEQFNNYTSIKESIDDVISKNLTNWSIDRIGKVELGLLRCYWYETKDEEFDTKVVNHILNLAKKYGLDDSYKFINGVIHNLNEYRKSI